MATLWVDTVIDFDTTIANQTALSLMSGVSSTETRFTRMTLLRTIVGLDVGMLVHDSGEGSNKVTLGIAIASQEAFAASNLPDPETSTDFPTRGWIWRARYRVFGFAADQPAVFTRRIDLDLGSRRKLENGEAYIIVTNEAMEGVNSTITTVGIVRQLWLIG